MAILFSTTCRGKIFLASSMDNYETEEQWLPKIPKVLRVDRKAIFALAAEEFGLVVQTENACQIDEDSFIAEITINNIKDRKSCEKVTKKFTGAPGRTKKESIQNAYHAILTFLEKEQMVIVDDYNANRVSELQKEVMYHNSWSMLFRDKVDKLNKTINATDNALRRFLSSFDSVCKAPVLHSCSSSPSPSKKRRTRSTTATTNSTDACMIPESFINLRAQFIYLFGINRSAETSIAKANA